MNADELKDMNADELNVTNSDNESDAQSVENESVVDETSDSPANETPVETETNEDIIPLEVTKKEEIAEPVETVEPSPVLEEEVLPVVIPEPEVLVELETSLDAIIPESIVEEADEFDEDEEDNTDYDSLSREELVQSIEKIVNVKAVEKIKRRVGLIKLAYLKLSKEEKDAQLQEFLAVEGNKNEDFKSEPDLLAVRFDQAFSIYKKNKKVFEDTIENERKANLEKKNNILDDIRKLIESEDELKITYDAFKKLQGEWRETGQVPHAETAELWRSYHFLVEKFLDKVRINEELRDLDRRKNLEHCIEMCEKAEELLLNPSINQSYKLLQQYHNEWKEIGPLPADKKEEVWDRFRQASIKVNERRREYFEKMKSEQHNNLAAKTVLCEKVEELAQQNFPSGKKWQETTEQILEIQNFWKTIGIVPPENKDELWRRFRNAINLFFNNKKEHFDGIKEEFLNNYNMKLDICNQAESIKTSQDWKKTTNDIIHLQNEWKKIGPLPKKQSDELWRKFRAACDFFFNSKKDYFSNIDAKEKENFDAKMALIEKVKSTPIEGDTRRVFDVIKEYQREFTAIGHVPMSEKEKVQNLFRDAINAKLDELKINPLEKKVMGYKSKFESVINDPRQNDLLKNEIRFISNKITQIAGEIQLWENNIGFFANSKSANILKLEFEQKIEKAKEEIKVLEEKLKFLRGK